MRGLCAVLMLRNPLLLKTLVAELTTLAPDPPPPASAPHSVCLNTLYASARNSKARLSPNATCLNSAMSKLVRRGLVKEFLPTSPNVKPLGAAYAAGLYSRGPNPDPGTWTIPERGSPTISGREPDPATAFATPALSVLKTGLNGEPEPTVVIPDHSHPPKNLLASPGCLKSGMSQT